MLYKLFFSFLYYIIIYQTNIYQWLLWQFLVCIYDMYQVYFHIVQKKHQLNRNEVKLNCNISLNLQSVHHMWP